MAEIGHPLEVVVAILLREPNSLAKVLADFVAIQEFDRTAPLFQPPLHDLRDRRLAGTRQAGKPDSRASISVVHGLILLCFGSSHSVSHRTRTNALRVRTIG